MALSVSTLHAPPHLACKSSTKSTPNDIPVLIPTTICSTVASSCVGHALLTKSSPIQSHVTWQHSTAQHSTAQHSSIVTQHGQCMPIRMLRTPQLGTAQDSTHDWSSTPTTTKSSSQAGQISPSSTAAAHVHGSLPCCRSCLLRIMISSFMLLCLHVHDSLGMDLLRFSPHCSTAQHSTAGAHEQSARQPHPSFALHLIY
jgi:hypothetical protein